MEEKMNRVKIISVVILVCGLLAITSCTGSNSNIDSPEVGQLKPVGLRCEYLVNPLGVDVVKPRLSWVCKSSERGQRQTAYRVLVASSSEKLKKDIGDLWDSGVVKSDQSIHVVYNGKPLQSDKHYYWK